MVFTSAAAAASAAAVLVISFVLGKIIYCCWISPTLEYRKTRRNGLGGPNPSFPLGNIKEMKKLLDSTRCISLSEDPNNGVLKICSARHDIHSTVFPYFARWQKIHGKVFVYWLGTEPFLYVAEPEFLRRMSQGVVGKQWGKPNVFKEDRKPMFGNGLIMVEGDEWVRHRHIIQPAFSPSNLKAMAGTMVETTKEMIERWRALASSSGHTEIDVEREITSKGAEIIAKTSFGINCEDGRKVFHKLRALQSVLFKSSRYVGVPFGKFLAPKQTLEASKLGKEIDELLVSIVTERRDRGRRDDPSDLLGVLLRAGRRGKAFTTRELVDECKTFFFGGHETTALALSWTLLLLAEHPRWQEELREEIGLVIGDGDVDFDNLAGLKKMECVMNEAVRLYPPAPNVQRQVREDIAVGGVTVASGTNIWIDVVAMHHDGALWGDDAHRFQPERFEKDRLYGGCKDKMGFLPFGFGGRMCVGRNFTMMEYKIVLTLLLGSFSFSPSPGYNHSPSIMLSLRPSDGLPLVVRPL